MRLHFQKTPWDIYIAAVYIVATTGILTAVGAGNPAAVGLIFFVPGYLLVGALFPESSGGTRGGIDWAERIGFSMGASLVLVALVGFLLNSTGWGITLASLSVSVALLNSILTVAAYLRRIGLPEQRRLGFTLQTYPSTLCEHTMFDRALTIALVGAIAAAGAAIATAILAPPPSEPFTEFYLLGPNGTLSGYPTNLTVNESWSVIVGVVNHESASVNYTVRVDLVGIRMVYNATLGFNETAEINRTTWTWMNITVANGANWTEPYAFAIPSAGLWRIQFLLFKDGEFSSPYRQVHLPITVS
jgi:uncharacterized membrane protein